jgi:MFS family permease
LGTESDGDSKGEKFRSLAIDLSPLRQSRDFRLLYTGQFVSTFGSAVSYVVLPLQMYQLTKSSLAVGMLGVVEFGPMFLMAFVGGALADYVDRRRLIVLAEAGLTLCCALLVFNALLPHPRAWVLYASAALFAALYGLHRPALEALTPRLVPAEQMPAVSGLASFRYSFNYIVGPALAGFLADGLGMAFAYSLDALTYVVSIVAVLLIRKIPMPQRRDNQTLPTLKSVTDGWKYALGRQELLGTYLIDLNAMFFGMPIALFPAMAASHGRSSVGLFYAMLPVGTLAVSLTSGWASRVRRHGLAITVAAAIWGAAIVGFGLAPQLWLALAFLAAAGAADTVSGIFRGTIWNQTIPDHFRGRLAGIEMISYLTGPYLGNAEAGLVAAAFGLRTSVVSGGILCVIGSAVLALVLPGFIRYDREEGLRRKHLEETGEHGTASIRAPL